MKCIYYVLLGVLLLANQSAVSMQPSGGRGVSIANLAGLRQQLFMQQQPREYVINRGGGGAVRRGGLQLRPVGRGRGPQPAQEQRAEQEERGDHAGHDQINELQHLDDEVAAPLVGQQEPDIENQLTAVDAQNMTDQIPPEILIEFVTKSGKVRGLSAEQIREAVEYGQQKDTARYQKTLQKMVCVVSVEDQQTRGVQIPDSVVNLAKDQGAKIALKVLNWAHERMGQKLEESQVTGTKKTIGIIVTGLIGLASTALSAGIASQIGS